MRLVRLLADRAGRRLTYCVVSTVVGGVLAAVVVAMFNEASARETGLGSWHRGLFFLGVLGAMFAARVWAARVLIEVFEETVAGLRDEAVRRLRRTSLRTLESRQDEITRLTADLSFVGTTLEGWVSGLQHLAFVAGATLTVAFISTRAFVLWSATLALLGWWLWPRLGQVDAASRRLSGASEHLGSRVEQLLDGLPQLKLDWATARAVLADIDGAVAGIDALQRGAEDASRRAFVGAIVALFVVGIGVAAFASPEGVGLPATESYALVAYFQIAWGPIFAVVTSVPQMVRAEAAAGSVLDTLAGLEPEPDRSQAPGRGEGVAEVELRGARFTYGRPSGGGAAQGGARFGVGPVDLRLRRGEITFLVGGNGSGKTTLVKMLLGLYPLESGRRLIDGRAIAPRQLEPWRALFTVILDGQHLFDRLYGLEGVPPGEVDAWLRRLGLTDAVDPRAERFDRAALSAGQRMRLAMVVALLEDRPICVFDEWTANQDPEMTRWYYDVLLPELAAGGRAVLAVSHDDRYFDRADRVIDLRAGRIVGRETHARP